jgi:ketosteroid isomerase-like protein
MPQETETVRDFYEAVNRRDFEQAERYFHPEVEIYPGIGASSRSPQRRGPGLGLKSWNRRFESRPTSHMA